MGSFSVLVIGEDVDKQLAPYISDPQTGESIPYDLSLNVDIQEEMHDIYLQSFSTCFVDPQGRICSPWESRFWRDEFESERGKELTSIECAVTEGRARFSYYLPAGYKRKVKVRQRLVLPKGYQLIKVPTNNIISFTEWAREKYNDYMGGYEILDQSQVPLPEEMQYKNGWIRINDNGAVSEWVNISQAHLSSWQVGDRDAYGKGVFSLKPDASGEPKYQNGDELPGFTNSARKRDIVFELMRNSTDLQERLPLNEYIGSECYLMLEVFAYVYQSRWYETVYAWIECPFQKNLRYRKFNCKMNALLDNLPSDTLLTYVSCED